MTTREELIDGLQMVMREGRRVTSTFSPDDWKRQVHGEEGGWDRKRVYCHITAVAEITPAYVPNLASLPEGGDAASGMDFDAVNAQLVSAREHLGEKELMDAFETAYEKAIDFVQTMPEEQLQRQTRFGALRGPVSDIMDSVLVLHSMAHMYSAGGSAVR